MAEIKNEALKRDKYLATEIDGNNTKITHFEWWEVT